jgi:hypothetical protein
MLYLICYGEMCLRNIELRVAGVPWLPNAVRAGGGEVILFENLMVVNSDECKGVA